MRLIVMLYLIFSWMDGSAAYRMQLLIILVKISYAQVKVV